MKVDKTNSIALFKDTIKKFIENTKNILYSKKELSAASYEKLALTTDSLKMLQISIDWYNKVNLRGNEASHFNELDESITIVIRQLKAMITDFEKGRLDNDKIMKLNEYIDEMNMKIQKNNNGKVKEMINKLT